jgi:hypothetical protein
MVVVEVPLVIVGDLVLPALEPPLAAKRGAFYAPEVGWGEGEGRWRALTPTRHISTSVLQKLR